MFFRQHAHDTSRDVADEQGLPDGIAFVIKIRLIGVLVDDDILTGTADTLIIKALPYA